MSHINLLPWREQLRERQKQYYLATLMAFALLTVGAVVGVGNIIESMILSQNNRNAYLEKELAILDVQIGKIAKIREQKESIEKKISLIRQLQEHRNVTPKVLDELARIVPPGLAVRSVKRSDNRLEIIGISESNNHLAEFMRRLEKSVVFINVTLSSVVADTTTSDGVSDYKLTFSISPAVAPPLVNLSDEQGGQAK